MSTFTAIDSIRMCDRTRIALQWWKSLA